MPLGGATFYGPKTGSGSETAYYYVEVLPGESGGTLVGGKYYKQHHEDTSPGTGYSVTKEDQYDITGYTFNATISTKIGKKYDNAKFYYTRNNYDVVFVNNGKTVHTQSYPFKASIAEAGSYTRSSMTSTARPCPRRTSPFTPTGPRRCIRSPSWSARRPIRRW